ncbi:hypothetical protein EZQ67_003148 [Escherichia coli]|nr:hypothetical protein [Escherichia coli]EES4904135.1 hypothetical protein [Escherichia coli]EFJ5644704.1 hypothetical protein [Escherichia coli]EHW3266051.1 hypothetical protein [Escherichia coli]HCJ6098211.1 hypothetical protein [Escherichia coli]
MTTTTPFILLGFDADSFHNDKLMKMFREREPGVIETRRRRYVKGFGWATETVDVEYKDESKAPKPSPLQMALRGLCANNK